MKKIKQTLAIVLCIIILGGLLPSNQTGWLDLPDFSLKSKAATAKEYPGDDMVYLTQRWLNQEYGDVDGFGAVTENGKTGWNVVYGLLRALQYELGITDLANSFGPTTTNLYSENLLSRQDGVIEKKHAILQGALWCKGYCPGYNLYEAADGTIVFEGVFDADVEKAVIELKTDAGFINPNGVVTVNVMKALMSMDTFKLLSSYGGTSEIRELQQKLNRKYEAYIGLTPCDGVYGRNTNKALIYALQAEELMPISVANGNFGNTTKLCCPQIPYEKNSASALTYPGDSTGSYYTESQITAITELLQFSLLVNGFGDGVIDGVFDSEAQQDIRNFQKEMALAVTGIADISTWMSLLVSCGDTSRSALAADCATILTQAKAKTLYDNGYRYVGRYLTGTYNGGISKAITKQEAEIIFDAGLRFFPIYQTSANYLEYFTSQQGATDAQNARKAATALGLPKNTIIYFAVDFDCLDYQITDNIIPYFKSVYEEMIDSDYKVGIYGTRNACASISNLGYACSSFVGDMSTGFSGNLGFIMPDNWAFDQFATITIGSGDGRIEIDKVAYSGRDIAVSKLNPTCNLLDGTINHTYNAGVVTKKATCKETGVKTYTCTVCNATKTQAIAKMAHSYKTTTTKATTSKNGKIVKKCSTCGASGGTTTIYAAKTVKLSATSYTYNGKVKEPTVTVKDSKGKKLKNKVDYTVTYASGRKNVGTYKVTIKFKGRYKGSKTLTFKINPVKTSAKLTAAKKALTVSISKKSTQVTGYQIQYATNKKFSKAKTTTVKSYKTTKVTLKKLSAKKTYYVRVRTYKTVNGKKYYSGWSTVKHKKTK